MKRRGMPGGGLEGSPESRIILAMDKNLVVNDPVGVTSETGAQTVGQLPRQIEPLKEKKPDLPAHAGRKGSADEPEEFEERSGEERRDHTAIIGFSLVLYRAIPVLL